MSGYCPQGGDFGGAYKCLKRRGLRSLEEILACFASARNSFHTEVTEIATL